MKNQTLPVLHPVRWAPYGRWTDDALHVIGKHGNVIYSVPGAPSFVPPAPKSIAEPWNK